MKTNGAVATAPEPATTEPANEPKSATITMVVDKPCKGSMRYAAIEPSAPVQTLYLSRSFAPTMPKAVQVTVTAAGAAASG